LPTDQSISVSTDSRAVRTWVEGSGHVSALHENRVGVAGEVRHSERLGADLRQARFREELALPAHPARGGDSFPQLLAGDKHARQ
jgi:hypothetical protein